MLFSLVFPLLIGAFGVFQNTLNKKIATNIGMPLALVINNFVLLGFGLLFYGVVKLTPAEALPSLFRPRSEVPTLNWWIFLPGFLGFFIIAAAPLAIERVGATRVFIGIIVAQIVASLLWDYCVEAIPLSPTRLAGATLALAGALLAAK